MPNVVTEQNIERYHRPHSETRSYRNKTAAAGLLVVEEATQLLASLTVIEAQLSVMHGKSGIDMQQRDVFANLRRRIEKQIQMLRGAF